MEPGLEKVKGDEIKNQEKIAKRAYTHPEGEQSNKLNKIIKHLKVCLGKYECRLSFFVCGC